MYKFDKNHQFGLADFNQPMGLKMNPENRWVKKSETIPWEAIEEKYAALFPSKKGMPAKPLRTSLGSLLIQKQSSRQMPHGTSPSQNRTCSFPAYGFS